LDILGTVQNLLRQCLEPNVFLKPLSKLFSIIQNRLSRQALCEAFQVIFRISSHFNITLVYFKLFLNYLFSPHRLYQTWTVN